MTPTELITAARLASNNENSSYFSDTELYSYLAFAIKESSTTSFSIEAVDSSLVSVADQADYTLPSDFVSVKRITYDGIKLRPSTFTELDKLVSAIQNTDSSGTPRFYTQWSSTLTLTPTPDTAGLVIKVYGYKIQSSITSTSTILVPEEIQHYLVDYVVYRMYLKEGDTERASSHKQLWDDHKAAIRRWMQERKRRDGFNIVQNEDQSINNILGKV